VDGGGAGQLRPDTLRMSQPLLMGLYDLRGELIVPDQNAASAALAAALSQVMMRGWVGGVVFCSSR